MVASIFSLFTPTVFFCILNLLIGTIFITSRFKLQKKQEQHPGQDAVNSSTTHHQPHLVRVPSLLDRVKSFDFSSYLSGLPDQFHSTTQHANPHQEQEKEQKVEELLDHHEHNNDRKMTMRSKSEKTMHREGPVERMKKSASEKAVVVEEEEQKQEQEQVVERRRPATVRERKGKWNTTTSFGDDDGVDKKADDFINRFRQQLKLQRLDSFLRYKEMLNRGVGR